MTEQAEQALKRAIAKLEQRLASSTNDVERSITVLRGVALGEDGLWRNGASGSVRVYLLRHGSRLRPLPECLPSSGVTADQFGDIVGVVELESHIFAGWNEGIERRVSALLDATVDKMVATYWHRVLSVRGYCYRLRLRINYWRASWRRKWAALRLA